MTRSENARLGVETTTKYDRTARSVTTRRSRGYPRQWQMARPNVERWIKPGQVVRKRGEAKRRKWRDGTGDP
jgi:hypothetical protein